MSRMIDDEEELKDYGLIEKCSNLVTDENKCLDTWDDENADYKECKRINCYYKQLQRAKAELEQYKKSKQASYESMQREWNAAINEYRKIILENERLKESQAIMLTYKIENEELKKEIETQKILNKKMCLDKKFLHSEIADLRKEVAKYCKALKDIEEIAYTTDFDIVDIQEIVDEVLK